MALEKKRGLGRGTLILALCAILFALLWLFALPFAKDLISLHRSPSTYIETSPSNFYGKLVDQNGKAVPNEVVIAEWKDPSGALLREETATLSRDDAQRLGDASLEGTFLFTKGTIRSPAGEPVRIKTLPRYSFVDTTTKPGSTQDVGKIIILKSTQPVETAGDEIAPFIPVSLAPPPERESKLLSYALAHWKLLLLFAALFSISSLAYSLSHKRRRKQALARFFMGKDLGAISLITLEEAMVRDALSIPKDTTAQHALSIMMDHHVNSLVVLDDKKPIGILTEDDFLMKYALRDISPTHPISGLFTPLPFSLQPSQTMVSAIEMMLERRMRKMPIVHNGELRGIFTFSDALRIFHQFFARHIDEASSKRLLGAKAIATAHLLCAARDDALSSIIPLMQQNDTGYVLVTENKRGKVTSLLEKDVLGIITTRDIIEELHKNQHALGKLKAVALMRSPIYTISPQKTAAQANDAMHEHLVRRLPLNHYGLIQGILLQENVVRSLIAYFKESGGQKRYG